MRDRLAQLATIIAVFGFFAVLFLPIPVGFPLCLAASLAAMGLGSWVVWKYPTQRIRAVGALILGFCILCYLLFLGNQYLG